MWNRRLTGGRSGTASIALAVLATLVVLPLSAEAAFPGANGKIAYDSGVDGDTEIYVVNPDGTGKTQLTQNSGRDANPAWSPDGSKIAFACCSPGASEVWVMSATGESRVKLTEGDGSADHAAWSPDGTKIAYTRRECPIDCTNFYDELWIVNADGTGDTEILTAGLVLEPSWSPDGTEIAIGYAPNYDAAWLATVEPDGSDFTPLTAQDNCFDYGPDWSPDGARIVFEGENQLFTINRYGTGRSRPCFPPQDPGESPVWSPDGNRIAFLHRPSGDNWQVHTANPDLTGEQEVTEIAPQDVSPGPPRGLDWQPIPINSYPRPKSTTPLETMLVPAYTPCTSPNRTHGPPLAFGSCNPPAMASGELTLGTADANGKPTKGEGLVRYATLAGHPTTPADEADVRIVFELRDVYDHSTLSDYTGELRLRTGLRITDKLNTPHPGGTGAGTVSGTALGTTVPCAATSDPGRGASCYLITSVDAVVPGAVPERKRSVWEFGQIQVDDGGADGDADTAGDNTLFMVQGVFVP